MGGISRFRALVIALAIDRQRDPLEARLGGRHWHVQPLPSARFAEYFGPHLNRKDAAHRRGRDFHAADATLAIEGQVGALPRAPPGIHQRDLLNHGHIGRSVAVERTRAIPVRIAVHAHLLQQLDARARQGQIARAEDVPHARQIAAVALHLQPGPVAAEVIAREHQAHPARLRAIGQLHRVGLRALRGQRFALQYRQVGSAHQARVEGVSHSPGEDLEIELQGAQQRHALQHYPARIVGPRVAFERQEVRRQGADFRDRISQRTLQPHRDVEVLGWACRVLQREAGLGPLGRREGSQLDNGGPVVQVSVGREDAPAGRVLDQDVGIALLILGRALVFVARLIDQRDVRLVAAGLQLVHISAVSSQQVSGLAFVVQGREGARVGEPGSLVEHPRGGEPLAALDRKDQRGVRCRARRRRVAEIQPAVAIRHASGGARYGIRIDRDRGNRVHGDHAILFEDGIERGRHLLRHRAIEGRDGFRSLAEHKRSGHRESLRADLADLRVGALDVGSPGVRITRHPPVAFLFQDDHELRKDRDRNDAFALLADIRPVAVLLGIGAGEVTRLVAGRPENPIRVRRGIEGQQFLAVRSLHSARRRRRIVVGSHSHAQLGESLVGLIHRGERGDRQHHGGIRVRAAHRELAGDRRQDVDRQPGNSRA